MSTDLIDIEHSETGKTARVTVRAFELAWSKVGWVTATKSKSTKSKSTKSADS